MANSKKIVLGMILSATGAFLGAQAARKLRLAMTGDPALWAGSIRNFAHQDRQKPPPPAPIVFTGSSSITFWGSLARDMAPMPVLNRGFGGALIDHCAYYADQTVIPYNPCAVVLFAGTNDIAWPRPKSAEQVFHGYLHFISKIHSALPETPIYYISITPSPSRRQYWPIVEQANRLIEAYTRSDERTHFIDLTPMLVDSHGLPRAELYRIDRLHPNARGYAQWTTVIKPILARDLFPGEAMQ